MPVKGLRIKDNLVTYGSNFNKTRIRYRELEGAELFYFNGSLPAKKTGFFQVSFVDENFSRGGIMTYDVYFEFGGLSGGFSSTIVIKLPLTGPTKFLGEYLSVLHVDRVSPTPSLSFVEGEMQVLVWRDPLFI